MHGGPYYYGSRLEQHESLHHKSLIEIRKVEQAEFAELTRLGAKFYAESGLPGKFVPEVFIANWTKYYEIGWGNIVGLFEGKVPIGAIGMMSYPDPNDGEPVAMEMFWFVQPESRGAGLKLLDEFERWAANRGAKRITMVHLTQLAPEVLRKLYLRKGYREIEVHFVKSL